MSNLYIKNIIRFVALVLLQVLLLNHLNIFGYLNPFVYLLFIIILPFRTNKIMLLFIAFLTGLVIDIFGNTPGLHSSATLFMAFMRPAFIAALFRKIEYTQNEEPNITKLGLGGFARYALLMVTTHQFILFLLEIASFSKLLLILKTTIFNSILSLVVIFIIMFLFSKRKR